MKMDSSSISILAVFACLAVCFADTTDNVDTLCRSVEKGGVNVFNCSGADIDQDTLPELPELAEVLDFSENDFTQFPQISESPKCHLACGRTNASSPCRLSISFRENDIETFDDYALHGLSCLQTLDLSYNDIKADVFHPAFFEEGAYYLQRLILKSNPLGELPDNVITHPFMPGLRHLDLSYCRLKTMGRNSVDDLHQLRLLDLSHNQLTDLHEDTFKGLTRLETLDLSENRLTYFSEHVFGDLSNLQALRLSGNNIKTFHNDAFYSDSDLNYLDLSNNMLDAIPYNIFDKLYNLNTLNLTLNPIKQINKVPDGSSTAPNSNLEQLILDNMSGLKEIRRAEFAPFRRMVSLSLSGCQSLTKIASGALGDEVPLLRHVRLENNWLTTLESDALPWKQLETLHLGGNPWLCDARLRWMMEATSIKGPVICAAPQNLKGRDLRTLSLEQLKKEFPIAPIAAIVVILLAIPVTCACVVFVYRRRRFCACTKDSLQGRYITVFSRDAEDPNRDMVDIELKSRSSKIVTVSNGGADDTKHLVKMEANGSSSAAAPDDEDDEEEI